MSETLTVNCAVHFQRRGHGGRKEVAVATAPAPTTPPVGRIPRVARLMALAIRCDGLLREGMIKDYATLANLGHVSRARISQIMNLLLLAPDIQEEVLFLPACDRGRAMLLLVHLQPIAAMPEWGRQRRCWHQWKRQVGMASVAVAAPILDKPTLTFPHS